MKREQEIMRATGRFDGERQLGQRLTPVLQQHQDLMNRLGQSPEQLFGNFAQISRVLNFGSMPEKHALFVQAMQQNGFDPRQPMVGGSPASQAPGAVPQSADPNALLQNPAIRQAIEAGNRVQQWERDRVRETQERQHREEQETISEITGFRQDPAHRYFDHVADHMTALLAGGAATTLQDAYEAAIWARPDIREQLLKDQQEQRLQQQRNQNRVPNARARAVSVRSNSGAAAPQAPQDRSLRDEIAANLRASQNGDRA